jgi:hypothetical protein
MKGFRRKTRSCKATTGTTFVLDGKQDFPCELPDDGHEWHERSSPPVRTRWRDLPGEGREYEYMKTV